MPIKKLSAGEIALLKKNFYKCGSSLRSWRTWYVKNVIKPSLDSRANFSDDFLASWEAALAPGHIGLVVFKSDTAAPARVIEVSDTTITVEHLGSPNKLHYWPCSPRSDGPGKIYKIARGTKNPSFNNPIFVSYSQIQIGNFNMLMGVADQTLNRAHGQMVDWSYWRDGLYTDESISDKWLKEIYYPSIMCFNQWVGHSIIDWENNIASGGGDYVGIVRWGVSDSVPIRESAGVLYAGLGVLKRMNDTHVWVKLLGDAGDPTTTPMSNKPAGTIVKAERFDKNIKRVFMNHSHHGGSDSWIEVKPGFIPVVGDAWRNWYKLQGDISTSQVGLCHKKECDNPYYVLQNKLGKGQLYPL